MMHFYPLIDQDLKEEEEKKCFWGNSWDGGLGLYAYLSLFSFHFGCR